MNPYVTLLERCGKRVLSHLNNSEDIFTVYDGNESVGLNSNQLKAYALEVGAQEAAKWYDSILVGPGKTVWKHGVHADGKVYWRRNECGRVKLFTDLELIQEVTKAGWEKGEGLSL